MALKFSSPSWEGHTPPEQLIDYVLVRLRITGKDQRSHAEGKIREIASDYTAACKKQRDSMKMSKARALVGDLPADLRLMAESLRLAQTGLDAYGATQRFFESPDRQLENRREIIEMKSRIGECAHNLDQLAEFIEPLMDRGKSRTGDGKTGSAKVSDILYGTAKRQLAENVVLLFEKWRPNDKVEAGQDGDLHTIIKHIYELATGDKPSDFALLTPLQEAITAYSNRK